MEGEVSGVAAWAQFARQQVHDIAVELVVGHLLGYRLMSHSCFLRHHSTGFSTMGSVSAGRRAARPMKRSSTVSRLITPVSSAMARWRASNSPYPSARSCSARLKVVGVGWTNSEAIDR